MPAGVYLSWSGAAQAQSVAQRQFASHVALAALAIVALPILTFPGVRPALLIVVRMPLALVGAWWRWCWAGWSARWC